MYFYSNASRTADPHAIPDAEVFYVDDRTAKLARERIELGDEMSMPGWYYWHCFPGCLPDGPANGPYNDALEAIQACLADAPDSIE